MFLSLLASNPEGLHSSCASPAPSQTPSRTPRGGGGEGGRGGTNLEGTQQTLVDTHHGTGIVKLSTVVGGTEQSYQLALGEELISVLDYLVGSADQVHVMFLQEP